MAEVMDLDLTGINGDDMPQDLDGSIAVDANNKNIEDDDDEKD